MMPIESLYNIFTCSLLGAASLLACLLLVLACGRLLWSRALEVGSAQYPCEFEKMYL